MSVYQVEDLCTKLSTNPYPGRGIVLGTSEDGLNQVAVYFIMGRSVNSRNRIFEKTEDGIITKAFDPSLMSDPSLIIYHPVRQYQNDLIVTNGDQTDTVLNGLQNGLSFRESLNEREFEPDAPNFTPRISGLSYEDGHYSLSILKSLDEEGSDCVRYCFDYPCKAGLGHFIHTYITDGNPIPSFCGEPERVHIENDIHAFSDKIWQALNPDNKISLYVRYTNRNTHEVQDIIINKHN